MKQFSLNIELVNSLHRVFNDTKLISFYKEEALKVWETYREESQGSEPGRHLISGYKAAVAKSEAIKSFTSYLIKLHLSSLGSSANTYSKVSLEKHNRHIKRVTDNLNGVPELQFLDAFRYICVSVLGWDDTLVEIGQRYNELSDEELFKSGIRYLFEAHDLLDELKSKPLEEMTEEELKAYQLERYTTCSITVSRFKSDWIKRFFENPEHVYRCWLDILNEDEQDDKVKAIELLLKV